jgi:23S rRNA (cytosine1962-C5)-methyltransferase
VDLFPPLLFMTVHRSIPPGELGGLLALLEGLIEVARKQGALLGGAAVQERTASGARVAGTAGEVKERLVIDEEGLRYLIEPLRGQNPGLFLDMRPGRVLVRRNARGRRVLNLFAYTCAFSVAAAAGGAREVVNVDMKRSVLERGRENHRLNSGGETDCPVRYLALDLMKSFSKIDRDGAFSFIIMDPPSRQGRSFSFRRDYPKLIRRAARWIPAGGLLLTCLNAPDASCSWLEDMVRREIPGLELLERIDKGDDFPEADPSLREIALLWGA